MSTNPTATSAYMSPTRRPLVMRSMKNSIASLACSSLTLSTSSSQRGEVGWGANGGSACPRPLACLGFPHPRLPPLGGGKPLHRHQCLTHTANDELGLNRRLAPVLIGNDRGHGHRGSIRIQRLDDALVFLGHKPAAHLASARDFLIVGIPFFVQQDVALDLHGLIQVAVHTLDLTRDELVHFRFLGQVGIRGVSHLPALSPFAD